MAQMITFVNERLTAILNESFLYKNCNLSRNTSFQLHRMRSRVANQTDEVWISLIDSDPERFSALKTR